MRKSTRPDFPSPQAGRHTLTSATTDDLPNAKRPRAIGSDLDAQKSRPANSNSEVNGYQHFAKPSIRSRSLPRKPEEQSIALPMEKGLGNTVAPPEDTAAWLFRLGFEPKMPIGAGTTGGEDVKTSAPSNDRISQSGHEHQSKHKELIDFNVQHLSLASRIPLAPPAIISEKLWRIEVPSAISDLLSEWTNLDRKKIASIASISRAKEKEQDDMWDARTETTESSASEDSWIEIRDKYASAEPGLDKQASAYAGHPGYTQVPPFHPTIDTSKKQGVDAADTSPGSDDVTRSKGSLIPLPADVAASLKGDEEEATDLKSVEQKFKDRMARLETLGEELQAARQAEREARQMAEAMNAEELKAVREHAKLEVKAAAEERERHQIMVDELKKKLAEVEATRKKSEEKAKRHNPIDDSLIGPVRFTDAIGRKFFVPWHICKTWKVRPQVSRPFAFFSSIIYLAVI